MARTTTRASSSIPSLLLAAGGVLLGAQLVHDLVDARLLTAASIFHSPLTAALAALGALMGAILIVDLVGNRRSR